MDKPKWGLCRNCEWWQIEPEAKITNETLGLCIDEELQAFKLRVIDPGCAASGSVRRCIRGNA